MKALDLFCGAGGASVGLARAGFEVTGVDIAPQLEYPYAFVLGDALDCELGVYDLVWASPPCQAFTAYKRRPSHVASSPNLIPDIRKKLKMWGGLWVIENVPSAPLVDPFILCGSMFGLDVRRHRHFETNFPVALPNCNHAWQTPRFAPATNRKNLRSTVEVGVWRVSIERQRLAMGISWMTLKPLSQSVPPAYADFIGRALS